MEGNCRGKGIAGKKDVPSSEKNQTGEQRGKNKKRSEKKFGGKRLRRERNESTESLKQRKQRVHLQKRIASTCNSEKKKDRKGRAELQGVSCRRDGIPIAKGIDDDLHRKGSKKRQRQGKLKKGTSVKNVEGRAVLISLYDLNGKRQIVQKGKKNAKDRNGDDRGKLGQGKFGRLT